MSLKRWRDTRHKCWVLEYKQSYDITDIDLNLRPYSIDQDDRRIAWIAEATAKHWPRATRMSYDQWYWYDQEEMEKFMVMYYLNFGNQNT